MDNRSAESPTWLYTDAEPTYAHGYIRAPVLAHLRQEPETRRVLDAGCGNGSLAGEMHAMGFEVCGFDVSDSGIREARRAYPTARFEIASAYDDLRALFGVSFDAAVSLEVIEHLYDPPAFLRRLAETLRPGGRLILSTPYHGYLKNLVISILNRNDEHYHPEVVGGHIKFWSRRTMGAALRRAGFVPRSFRGAGRLPFLWK
ncbi:MAG: class I SAM-dependent methyltransferase, partial [bacterium]|nr:class I SAM-dependent methyltransferase [bacterium]